MGSQLRPRRVPRSVGHGDRASGGRSAARKRKPTASARGTLIVRRWERALYHSKAEKTEDGGEERPPMIGSFFPSHHTFNYYWFHFFRLTIHVLFAV